MTFVIIPKITLKKKIFIFTITPHPGYHVTLPGCFVRRGLPAMELSAGRKVRGNIFFDALEGDDVIK